MDLGENIVTRDEEKVRYLTPLLIVVNSKPVVLRVTSTLSEKTGTGSRVKPP